MSWPGWESFVPQSGTAPACVSETRRPGRIRGAQPTEVDGHLFPSKREADRYAELRLEEHSGAVFDLRLQFRFPLDVQGTTIGHYVADFVYTRNSEKVPFTVVEDVKGWRTEMYRWKKKHFEAQYGLTIQEV